MNYDQVKSGTHSPRYGCGFLASTLFLTFILKEIGFSPYLKARISFSKVSAGLIWSRNSSHSLWLGCLVLLHCTNCSLFSKHFLGIQDVSGTVTGLKMIAAMTRYKFTFTKEFIFIQFYFLPTRKYESKQFFVWEEFPDYFPQWL